MKQRVLNESNKGHNEGSVGFDNSVCYESLLTSFIMLLDLLFEDSLGYWHQQCVSF